MCHTTWCIVERGTTNPTVICAVSISDKPEILNEPLQSLLGPFSTCPCHRTFGQLQRLCIISESLSHQEFRIVNSLGFLIVVEHALKHFQDDRTRTKNTGYTSRRSSYALVNMEGPYYAHTEPSVLLVNLCQQAAGDESQEGWALLQRILMV